MSPQPDTAPAGTTSEEFGWALGVLLRSYRDLVLPALDGIPHGSRGYETLAEVVRTDQPSQLALAHRLGIDRTVMTYLIDDLVTAGLVERLPNPHDRRQRRIVATTRGRHAIATLCEQMADAERRALEALDDTERAAFRRLLDKAACGNPLAAHPADACQIANDVLTVPTPPADAPRRSRRPRPTKDTSR